MEEEEIPLQLLWEATPAQCSQCREGVLTLLLSLPAGVQADPEAGEHHSPEEGESLVGEAHQAGEAPTVFGP